MDLVLVDSLVKSVNGVVAAVLLQVFPMRKSLCGSFMSFIGRAFL